MTRIELRHGRTSGHYVLVDANRRIVSTANATPSGVIFDLPDDFIDARNGCMEVLDAESKPATNPPSVYLSLRLRHERLLNQRQVAGSALAEFRRKDADLREQLEAIRARLTASRASTPQSCATCQADEDRLASLAANAQIAAADIAEHETLIQTLDGRIRQLESARAPMEWCVTVTAR